MLPSCSSSRQALVVLLLLAAGVALPACQGSDAGPPAEDSGALDQGAPAPSGSDAGGKPPGCAPSETLCGAACANRQQSPAHCGACGKACGSGEQCVAGSCLCPSPLRSCDGEVKRHDQDVSSSSARSAIQPRINCTVRFSNSTSARLVN